MKTAVIKMKSYARSVNIADSIDLRRWILSFMLASLGILALLYVILLGNTVFNIVERRALEGEARVLGNEVGELELVYLSTTSKIDPALGASFGFKEIKAQFITKKSLSSSTVASNEI